MLFNEALEHASTILKMLQPHCERIEIAGSIRRKKDHIGDIEIVCIPRGKMQMAGKRVKTFKFIPCMGFIEAVNKLDKVKGEAWDKYTQRLFAYGTGPNDIIKVDIFTANKDNWGYIYAIRTGSAIFSHEVLANGWVKKGYRGKDGYLTKNGVMVPVPDEHDLFALIGIDYVAPEKRNM